MDIVKAYKSGLMTPQEMAEFEQDVNSGAVMLPRGVSLFEKTKGALSKPEPILLSQGVTDAYVKGLMTKQEKQQLESDIKNGLVKLRPYSELPEFDEQGRIIEQQGQGIIQPKQEPTLGEKIKGTAQTIGTTAASLTGGAVGQIGGTLGGLAGAILSGEFGTDQAAKMIEQVAMEGAEKGTKALYNPELNPVAQRQLQGLAEITAPLAAITPMAAEIGAASRLLGTAKPVIQERVIAPIGKEIKQGAESVAQAAKTGAQKIKERVTTPTSQETGAPSVGAAGLQQAEVRLALNEELPYPLQLTQGTATRDPIQLKFEVETAKLPVGEPLREVATKNRNLIDANFDAFIDETGATATSALERGKAIMSVVDDKIAKDRANIKTGYDMARAAGELESPTTISSVANLFNDWGQTARVSVPVVKTMLSRGQELGVLKVLDDGTVTPVQAPLKNIVQFRQDVGSLTKWDDARDSNFGTQLKKAVDADTQTAGGKLYQKANAMRAKLGAEIERRVLVRDLIATKPNSTDRKVAYENVLDKIISQSTSRDQLRDFKIYLLKEGDAGRQAWSEVQGGLVKELKDKALSGATKDENGNLYFKPDAFNKQIEMLDKSGKLELVFGSKGAEKMRLLRDMASDVSTVPRGVANESGTATTMAYLMDLMLSGSTGVPAPIATSARYLIKNIKDKKLRVKVEKALDTSNLRNQGGQQ